MLEVIKEKKGNIIYLTISGTLCEVSSPVNFSSIVGELPVVINVTAKDVRKVNSFGIKLWVNYFSTIARAGTKIIYNELSPQLVEQLNIVSGFKNSQVMSVMVPHSCNSCHKNENVKYDCAYLFDIRGKVLPIKCSHCGGVSPFDDHYEDYFQFLYK